MGWMKDNSVLSDPQLTELIQLATQCSEEIVTITMATMPDTPPSGTPSSTPPSRRKRRQRQSRPKSPNKEKSNVLSLPISGGAGSIGKGTKQPVVGEEEQLVMLTVPLTSNWNAEIVHSVELEPEPMVSPCLTAFC